MAPTAAGPDEGKGPMPARHSPCTTDDFDPKKSAMIAEGILLVSRACPFDRLPGPDHSEGPPAQVSHANGHRPGELALRDAPSPGG